MATSTPRRCCRVCRRTAAHRRQRRRLRAAPTDSSACRAPRRARASRRRRRSGRCHTHVRADWTAARRSLLRASCISRQVVAITPFDGEEATAVALANDSEYGLSACVYTGSAAKGARVAARIKTGQVPHPALCRCRLPPTPSYSPPSLTGRGRHQQLAADQRRRAMPVGGAEGLRLRLSQRRGRVAAVLVAKVARVRDGRGLQESAPQRYSSN